METKDIPTATYAPWHPMTSPPSVKTLTKLMEELGECTAASARCLMQGIDEREPVTGKMNRLWLEDEMADVMVCIEIAIEHFGLDWRRINERSAKKKPPLIAWHRAA